MRTYFALGDRVLCVEVSPGAEPGRLRVEVDGRAREVEVLRFEAGCLLARLDGRRFRAFVAREGDVRWVKIPGRPAFRLRVARTPQAARARKGGDDRLAASMHSQVVSVEVREGQRVRKGDVLVVLEAMKMETRLLAPHDGRVVKVSCAPGDVVEPGVALVELESAEETDS